MSYPVGKVAEFAGVTVRTLHHYDEIGLLSPGERSASGYRRYAEADLERLQQILYYRELGFALEEIAGILDDPRSDAAAHLRRQHELLTARIKRLEQMLAAIEFAMEARTMGIQLTPEERFEVFGDFDPDVYAEEAEQRWGGTDAYAESARRTRGYTTADWARFKAQSEDWSRRLSEAMDAGLAPESTPVMELAEEHRRQISEWFYECSYEIHTGLADMYLADDRFTQHYERVKPGMARFLHDAIHANAVTRA